MEPHFFCVARVYGPLATLLLAVFLFIPSPGSAADNLGALIDRSDSPGEAEELFEELAVLREHKIPVNTASEAELLRLPFLSVVEIRRISDYTETGSLENEADLALLVGQETAALISPFLDFSVPVDAPGPKKADRLSVRAISRWYTENPERRGITIDKYAGSNDKFYNRFDVTYGGLGVYGVMEKDIGEEDIADFSSLSIGLKTEGPLRQLVVGNYKVSVGQGLLLGQGRYLSKGVDPLGVSLRGAMVKPYSSAAEYGFMQGVGAVVSPGSFDLMGFYSDNRVDASVDEGMVTTIRTSGYHRTESERLHDDNVRERVHGGAVRYRFGGGDISGSAGLNVLRYRYGLPLEDAGGAEGWQDGMSVDVSLLAGETNVFGEVARAGNDMPVSWIVGSGFPIAPGVESVVSVRDYHRDYFSPFASAFAERGDAAANEEGYYAGLKARVLRNLQVGASYDMFRFPAAGSRYGLSASGEEAKVTVAWKPIPSLAWDLMLLRQDKGREERFEEELEYSTVVPYVTNRYRLELEARLARWLSLKGRGEFKQVRARFPAADELYFGRLLFTQAALKSGGLSLKGRFTLFSTDGYDAVVYAYEDDLPYVFNLQGYYGSGRSMFVVLNWKLARFVQLSGKYEQAWYDDRDDYSSGYDLRPGSSPASWHLGCIINL